MTHEPREGEQTDRSWRSFPCRSHGDGRWPTDHRDSSLRRAPTGTANGTPASMRGSLDRVIGRQGNVGPTACVFGLGSDIGSNLISQNDPHRDGFAITAAVTKAIPGADTQGSLEALAARLVLADSALLGRVEINPYHSALRVDNRVIEIHFRDVDADQLHDIGQFDFGFVATHRRHVRDMATMEKIRRCCNVVLGAAENPRLPALYGPLLDAPLHLVDALTTRAIPSDEILGMFALGSCQCVGWSAQLRGLLEAVEVSGRDELGLRRMEVDIVHPDTASGRLGTHMIGAREEDPRNNLRPGASQLETSLRRFSHVQTVNTVSLRVLTQPPGYQICRFFTEALLSVGDVREGLERARCILPHMIATTMTPIGSRVFAAAPQVATIITAPSHLTVGRIAGTKLSLVTMQSYVHNTVGYCRSVLGTASRLLAAEPVNALAALDAAATSTAGV